MTVSSTTVDTTGDGRVPMQTYAAFEDLRAALLRVLGEVAETERALGLGEAAAGADALGHKVSEGVFRVLVLGEFKRGKSTLVNALLGAPILPANVTPTTALLTVVRYGEPPSATLRYYDSALAPRQVTLDELRDVLTLSGDERDNRRRQGEIRLVEVAYPAALCRNNVELVDSPGLNEHATRTELTSNYIAQCDAALFVLSATNFGSVTESAFIADHLAGRGLRHIFFAVNQLDRVLSDADEPERELRAVQALARARLGPLCQVDGRDLSLERIHFVSARPALRARQSGDTTALEASGLPALERSLEGFLTHDRGRVMLARPVSIVRDAVDAASQAAAFRRRALAIDLDVLEARARQVEPEFTALQENKARILAAIETARGHAATAMELSLRCKVGELADGLPDAVDDFTIDAAWGPGAIRTELVAQTNAYIERELNRWAETMGGEMQAELERLVAEIGADAATIDASLRRIRLRVLEGDTVLSAEADEARSSQASGDPGRIIETILSAGGSRVRGDIEALFGGGPGWLGTAVRVIAFQLAAGALVAALGLSAAPLVAVSTAVGAAILALISRRGAIERALREGVAESAGPEIARIPERALPALRERVDDTFDELAAALGTGIDVLIDNVRATIDGALADRRAREHELEPELQRLSALDERLAGLHTELTTLAAQLDEPA